MKPNTTQSYPKLQGPIIWPKSAKIEKILLFLHGYGADGNDLISLSEAFSDSLPNCLFIAPNGPFPCGMAPYGREWFPLNGYEPDRLYQSNIDPLLKAAHKTFPILSNYIDDLLKTHFLKEEDLGYFGFSQGSMMSLFTALRRSEACAGVASFSGGLLHNAAEDAEIISKPKILLVHGQDDELVDYQSMVHTEALLKQHHIPVTSMGIPSLGHSIDQAGLDAAVRFFEEAFKS